MITLTLAASLFAQAATPIVVTEEKGVQEVAYEELAVGEDRRAIEIIEANESLDADDPARLINLGIAHARIGDEAAARELFRSAANSDQRMELETATGEWEDSRMLAKIALRKLDNGEFSRQLAASR